MNIIHNLYENLFSFKPFSVYFLKQKKKTPSKSTSTSNSSCSDGGNNATVGYPVSAAPAIRTISVHPEALTCETIKPYGRVQASSGYRPHWHRAWHLLHVSRLGFRWKLQVAAVLHYYAYYMHFISIRSSWFYIVTSVPIAKQRLCKHIPARANAHKNHW
jgi:hypothetical protein